MNLVTDERIINVKYVKEIFIKKNIISIEKSDGRVFALREYGSDESAKTALMLIAERLRAAGESGNAYMPNSTDIQARLAAIKQAHRDDRTEKGHKLKKHGGS